MFHYHRINIPMIFNYMEQRKIRIILFIFNMMNNYVVLLFILDHHIRLILIFFEIKLSVDFVRLMIRILISSIIVFNYLNINSSIKPIHMFSMFFVMFLSTKFSTPIHPLMSFASHQTYKNMSNISNVLVRVIIKISMNNF